MKINLNNFNVMSQNKDENKEIKQEVNSIISEIREKFGWSTVVSLITNVEEVNTNIVSYEKDKVKTTYKLTERALLNSRGIVEIGEVQKHTNTGNYFIDKGNYFIDKGNLKLKSACNIFRDNLKLKSACNIFRDNLKLKSACNIFRVYLNPGKSVSYYNMDYIEVIGQNLTKQQAFDQVVEFLAKQKISSVKEVLVWKDDKKAHYSGIEKLGKRYEITEEMFRMAC